MRPQPRHAVVTVLLALACVRASAPVDAPAAGPASAKAAKTSEQDPSPPPAGALRVVGPDGQGVAATVCVSSDPYGAPNTCVTTRRDGWTEEAVARNAPANATRQWVLVTAPGHCSTQVERLDDDTIELESCATTTISGRVLGADGPVAGARLWASMKYRALAWATSDEKGNYELVVDAREWLAVVRAQHGSSAPGSRTVLAPADGVDITLFPESSISGVVVDDAGNPLPGAPLRTLIGLREILDARYFPERTISDEQGRFELSGLWIGTHRLLVDAPQWRSDAATVELGIGRRIEDLELVSRRGRLVELELFDPEGQPCVDGSVRLLDPSRPAVLTAPGRWSFADVPSGGRTLVAHCTGSRRVTVDIDVRADVQLRVDSERGARVTGRVIDEHGEPVLGAAVHVVGAGNHEGTGTDHQGRFELAGLEPGKIRLDVTAIGVVPEDHPELDLGADESAEVELRVSEGVCLVGRLEQRSDDALAVVLHGGSGLASVGRPERGIFRACGLRPGEELSLEVVSGTWERVPFSTVGARDLLELPVKIPKRRPLQPIELQVSEVPDAELSVVLRTTDKAPDAGALLMLMRPRDKARTCERPELSTNYRVALSDDQGRASFDELWPGDYELYIETRQGLHHCVDTHAKGRVEIELPRP